MKIDVMIGKQHGKYVLSVDGKRIGMKDGFGYRTVAEFYVKPEELKENT